MNSQHLEQLWEASRDGTIDDADRLVLEDYLRDHPDAAALWQAESQWLALLRDVDGAFDEDCAAMTAAGIPVRNGQAFAASVIEQWQAQQEREALGVADNIAAGSSDDAIAATDVLARIGRHDDETATPQRRRAHARSSQHGRLSLSRFLFPFAGVAAAIALIVLAALYGNFAQPDGASQSGHLASITSPSPAPLPDTINTPDPAAPDAIGLLFASAKERYSLAAASPARIKQGFSNTAAFLDVSTLTNLLDPDLPDPADFVEPRAGG